MEILRSFTLAISICLKNKIFKNIFLRYIIPVILPLILTGCYEDFTPKIETTPVLCLNSLITAGEPIYVQVTHTWVYSDLDAMENHSVSDAVVGISVNGERKEADYLAQEGDHIRITADSPTYGHAEAEVTVPYAVPIKDLRYTPMGIEGEASTGQHNVLTAVYQFRLNIEIDIFDPADTENYYGFATTTFNNSDTRPHLSEGEDEEDYPGDVTVYGNTKFYGGTLDYEAEPIFGEHIGVFESMLAGGTYNFSFFTDRQFSGSNYTLHLKYSNVYYGIVVQGWTPDTIDFGYSFTLYSISKSYYNWVNYKWQHNYGGIDDLSEVGLGEPIWAYSNVSTGAGVVAARAATTYTLNLKDLINSLIQKD